MASSSSSSAAPGGGARKSGSGTGVTSNNKGGAMSLFSFMPKRQAAVEVADELEAKRRRTAAAAMGKLPTPAKGGSPQASQEQEVPGSKDSTGSGVAAAPLQEQDDPKTPLFGKRSSASPAMASKKDRLLPSEDSDVEMGAAARAEETDPMLRTERKLTQKESRALESELIRSHTPGRAAGSSSAASAIAGNRKSAASGKPKSSSAGPNRVSEGVRAAGIKATSSSSSCAQPPAAASEEAPQEKLAMSEHWKSELAMAQGGIKTTRMKGGEDASAFGLSSSATGGLNAKNLNEYFRKIVDWQSQALYYHQWPSWLLPENIKDKHGRRPDHPDYDQTSLLLPKFTKEMEKDEATKKWLTPMMKQFWQIKKDNFDKVLLFKVGKFYEVFFYDAYLAHDVCDFKWMGKDPRPHVGFPEPVLHLNAAKLVEAGYCSVVVEQIETVEEAQAKKEARKAGGEKGGTVTVERGACEVFTPGTLVHENMMRGRNQDSYFLCVLRQEENTNNFGLCLIDVASGVFRVGYLQDRGEWGQLRTMLAQTQPREVVYHPKHVAPGVIKMLKLMPVRPACTPFDDGIDSISNAKKTVQDEVGKLEANKLTVEVEDVLLNQGSTFALAASFKYLGSILLKNHVLPIAKWSVYDPAVVSQKHMVLDATALDNLEILRRSDGKYEGSLLHFLDKTNTAFGFRLLKRWLCAPLMVPPEIRKRQDVVDVLVDHPDAAQRAKDALKKLPDMERGFVKLCSLGTTLQQRKAVLYQDFIGKRLTDFFKLLDAFDEGQRLLLQLAKDLPPAKELPVRLQQLLTLQEKDDKSSASGALLPDLQALNKEFKTAYVYQTGEGRNMTYRPKVGKSKAYDAIVQQKQDCEGLLENELTRLQKKFPKVEMKWVHRLPAYRYEIEAPDSLDARFAQDKNQCVQTSSRKGFMRFHTPAIEKLLKQLDEIDNKERDAMYPFAAEIFSALHKCKGLYEGTLTCLAEADVFLSMAQASSWSPNGDLVKPEFREIRDAQRDLPVLDLKGARHPVQEAQCQGFVANDTLIPGKPSIVLVTGPNMGGKSTILRQAALAVVMAQTGFRVAASSLTMTPVDRIFTRVGAQDSLIEGKSTFLMELEECGTILREASKWSLAIIDELGRGTSTFDGAAIALAVLEHLATVLKCRTLFATHYHLLGTHQSDEIIPYFMDVDTSGDELIFLYKLVRGLCPDSHGRNVAKLAGLPPSVVEDASIKSEEWRKEHESQGPELLLQQIVSLAEKGDKNALQKLFENRKEWARCL